jgi:hypothetical protein
MNHKIDFRLHIHDWFSLPEGSVSFVKGDVYIRIEDWDMGCMECTMVNIEDDEIKEIQNFIYPDDDLIGSVAQLMNSDELDAKLALFMLEQ